MDKLASYWPTGVKSIPPPPPLPPPHPTPPYVSTHCKCYLMFLHFHLSKRCTLHCIMHGGQPHTKRVLYPLTAYNNPSLHLKYVTSLSCRCCLTPVRTMTVSSRRRRPSSATSWRRPCACASSTRPTRSPSARTTPSPTWRWTDSVPASGTPPSAQAW